MIKFVRAQAPDAQISPLRKSLKSKLIVIIIAVSLAPLILWNIISFNLITFSAALPLALLSAIIGILVLWHFLKPIDQLYHRNTILIKNEVKEEVDIKEKQKELIKNQETNAPTIATNTLSAIASSIKDGVVVMDQNQKILYVNRPAAEILGYPSSTMMNKNIDDLIDVKDINDKTLLMKDYYKQEGLNNPSLVHIQSKNGKNSDPLEVILSKVTDDSHPDLGCILVLHDTAQEKALQQMQIDFVSMASHEFRTPLTSIINYLAVLSEEAKKKLAAEQQEFLDRALSSAKEMSALVDNILNVSKVERGSMSLSLKSIDWKKKLKQVVDTTQTQAAFKRIRMTLNVPTTLPNVMADEIRISEVLNNLVSNAIVYNQEGGKIDISAKVDKDQIITSVSDTGTGIPKEALAHLFTKFYRAPGSLEKNNQGSGLGLYLSKSIVDLHQGKIWVESEEGKGSTFFFSLPVATAEKPTIIDLKKTQP